MEDNTKLAAVAIDESEYVSEFTGPEIDDSIRAIKNSTYGLKKEYIPDPVRFLESTSSSQDIIFAFSNISSFKRTVELATGGGIIDVYTGYLSECSGETYTDGYDVIWRLMFTWMQSLSLNQSKYYWFEYKESTNLMTADIGINNAGLSNVVNIPLEVMSLVNNDTHANISSAIGGISAFNVLLGRLKTDPIAIMSKNTEGTTMSLYNVYSTGTMSLVKFLCFSVSRSIINDGQFVVPDISDIKISLDTASQQFSVTMNKGTNLLTSQIVNDLISTSTTDVLSAAQGNVLKEMIDEKNPSLSKSLTQGWYRIATLLGTHVANGAIVSLSNGYNHNAPGIVTFLMFVSQDSFVVSTMMKVPYSLITKVRVVRSATNLGHEIITYIDVYYDVVSINTMIITASNVIGFTFKNFEEATIPEGYVTTEVTL